MQNSKGLDFIAYLYVHRPLSEGKQWDTWGFSLQESPYRWMSHKMLKPSIIFKWLFKKNRETQLGNIDVSNRLDTACYTPREKDCNIQDKIFPT